MMKRTVLLLGAGLSLATVTGAQTPTATSSTLPDLPGRDVTIRVCSGCHAPAIVAQHQLDKAGWQEMVDTMAGRGANASDAELVTIVDYLSHAFPAPKGSHKKVSAGS